MKNTIAQLLGGNRKALNRVGKIINMKVMKKLNEIITI